MTGPERDHTPFDELAAGHLLHALDEEDEQRFLRHAEDCPRCSEILAGLSDVLGALAEIAPPAEPPTELGERIMAVVRAGPAGNRQPGGPVTGDDQASADRLQPSGPAAGDDQASADGLQPSGPAAGTAEAPRGRVIPLARRQVPRWARRAAAAAAAVIVIGGGIWAGLAATSSSPSYPSSCAHQRACAEVPVASLSTHRQAATVVVVAGSVYLTPTRMPPDNLTAQIYVLWQIPKGRAPLAVGSFDVHAGPNPTLKIGTLVAPYGHTAAFAISLEHGRKIPPAPSKVVAAGPVA